MNPHNLHIQRRDLVVPSPPPWGTAKATRGRKPTNRKNFQPQEAKSPQEQLHWEVMIRRPASRTSLGQGTLLECVKMKEHAWSKVMDWRTDNWWKHKDYLAKEAALAYVSIKSLFQAIPSAKERLYRRFYRSWHDIIIQLSRDYHHSNLQMTINLKLYKTSQHDNFSVQWHILFYTQ